MAKYSLGFAPFVDFLLIVVIVIIAMINPPVDPTIELKPKALIQVEWQSENRADVDTHVVIPTGEHVSYRDQDIHGRVNLTRDDIGRSYNSSHNLIATNLEVVEIFEYDEGVYTIWVRLFARHYAEEDPEVRVTLMDLKDYSVLLDKTVTLVAEKQTIAIAKFYVDAEGNVFKVDDNINVKLPGRNP